MKMENSFVTHRSYGQAHVAYLVGSALVSVHTTIMLRCTKAVYRYESGSNQSLATNPVITSVEQSAMRTVERLSRSAERVEEGRPGLSSSASQATATSLTRYSVRGARTTWRSR